MDLTDRAEAARLLGVPADADAAQVRRAYRMWARVAHPDVGGDPAAFARLTQARRTLLRPPSRRAATPVDPPPPPRAPVTAVVRMPPRWPLLLIAALGATALVLLPLAGAGVPAAALAAGMGSATWSAIATRAILRRGADAGHRILVLAWTWLPLAGAQVALSAAWGTGMVEVLPLLALPFVAVVASVNAGAGLWRPTGRQPGGA